MRVKTNYDKQKAKSLKIMAQITLERLNSTDKEKYPSNTLNDYYDVIHKLIEALAFLEAIKFRGEGAHKELVDYVCNKYALGEANRILLQEIRDHRNRISYEGFNIKASYIKNNKNKIEKIIDSLLGILNEL